MTKREILPVSDRKVWTDYMIRPFRGAKVINEPTTMRAFRAAVENLDKSEDGFEVALTVYREVSKGRSGDKDKTTWHVFDVEVYTADDYRAMLLAIAPYDRPTPFITKVGGVKTWHSLDTLIGQFTEIFGPSQNLFVEIKAPDQWKELRGGEPT